MKKRTPPGYKVYFSYLEKQNLTEDTLTEKQIAVVFNTLKQDFLVQKLELWDLSVTSGHLLHKLRSIFLSGKEIDHQLEAKLEWALDLEYYLPQYIKEKKWLEIGELFKLVFE